MAALLYQFPPQHETSIYHTLQIRGRQPKDKRVGRLRMQIAAKPLELRRQQQHVRLVELLHRRASQGAHAVDRAMHRVDLGQGGRAPRAPEVESE